MLISKEQFCHFANRLANCCRERKMFHDALRPYFDSPVCNYMQIAVDSLEELLVIVSECGEEDGIFLWWTEECNIDNCIIEVQDTKTGAVTEYNVLTAEGLYNYLYDMYHHED